MSARTERAGRPAHERPRTGKRQGESARDRRERLEAEREAAFAAARRRRTVTWLAVGLALALVAAVGITWAVQRARRTAAPTASVASMSARPVKPEPGRPLAYGNPDAKTVIEIWENPRCPHCVEFQEKYAGMINDAVRENRVALHIYGLTGGDPTSVPALHGLACAAEAGYGLQFWDGIYQNPQAEWNQEQLVELYRAISGQSDATAFGTCTVEKRHAAWLESMSEAARTNKIEYTPTLRKNGVEVDYSTLTPEKMKDVLQ